MKYLMFLVAVLFSTQAMAVTLNLTCKTKSGIFGYENKAIKYKFSFGILPVKRTDDLVMKKLGWNEDYEVDLYVDYKPALEQSPLWTLNLEPYVRYEKTASGKDIIKVTADNISMNYITLVLYKNSDYKRGYIVTRMYGEESEYSKISCR